MPKVKIASKPKPKTIAKPIVKTIKKAPINREKIEESIRLKAYELYLQRNGQEGNDLSDWLKAEKLVLRA